MPILNGYDATKEIKSLIMAHNSSFINAMIVACTANISANEK